MNLKKSEIAVLVVAIIFVSLRLPLERSLAIAAFVGIVFMLARNYYLSLLALVGITYTGLAGDFGVSLTIAVMGLGASPAIAFVQKYFIKKESRIFFPPQAFAILGLVALAAVFGAAGGDTIPLTVPFGILPLATGALIIYHTKNMTLAKRLFWALSIITIIFGIIGIFEGKLFQEGISTIQNRNNLGRSIITILPLSFALLITTLREQKSAQRTAKSAVLFASVLFALFIVFLTGSRGNMIGIGVIMASLLLDFPKSKAWPALAIVLLLAAPFFYWNVEKTVARAGDIAVLVSNGQDASRDASLASVIERKNLVFDTTGIFFFNPVFGAGFGNSKYLLGAKGYTTPKSGIYEMPAAEFLNGGANSPEWQKTVDLKDTHDAYTKILAETGIIGALFYAMILIFTFIDIFTAKKHFRQNGEQDGETLTNGAKAAFLGAITFFFFSGDPFYISALVVISIAIALKNISINLNTKKPVLDYT